MTTLVVTGGSRGIGAAVCVAAAAAGWDVVVDYARVRLRDRKRFERVEGVARIEMSGLNKRQVRVNLDPQRLRTYGVTPAEISAALARQNIDLILLGLMAPPEAVGTYFAATRVASLLGLIDFAIGAAFGHRLPARSDKKMVLPIRRICARSTPKPGA